MTNEKYPLTRPQRMLLALLRGALWGERPAAELFAGADEALWRQVMALAGTQGVTGLAYEALPLLAEGPPRGVVFTWAAGADAIERRAEKQYETGRQIAALLWQQGIRTLVLKGAGVARYYPVPAHRESGDVDIYLFGDHDRGERALAAAGARPKKGDNDKHTGFTFKGVMVENHMTILDEEDYPEDRIIGRELLALLSADESLTAAPAGEPLFPGPDFNAIYLMRHALSHLAFRQFALRHFCDLTLLLTRERGRIDMGLYRRVMQISGQARAADAVVSLAVRYFGLDPAAAPPYTEDRATEDRLMSDILSSDVRAAATGGRLSVIGFKWRRIQSYRFTYSLVYPGRWGAFLWFTVKHLLFNPGRAVEM